MDNLAQAYYLLDKRQGNGEDSTSKKRWPLKPGQIDTLYFLAQYDIEDGNQEAAAGKAEKGAGRPLFAAQPRHAGKWSRSS